jgi:drug/metabolite transporter (DMT)-like permease
MSPLAFGIFLLVTSAFLHALWNAQIKRFENKEQCLFYVILAATLFSGLLAPWTGGFVFGGQRGILFTVLAGLFEGGYFLCMAKSLKRAPLGVAYAIMRGGAMMVVWIISVCWLGEKLNSISFLGVALIGCGLYFVQPRTEKTPDLKAGILWSFAAAFFIAGYHLCYGFSIEAGASQVSLFMGSMFVSLPILAVQARIGQFWSWPVPGTKQRIILVLTGVVSAVSFILFLYGLPKTGPGYAITLRNTSVGWAQVFAFMMGEKISKRQITAVGVILGGALLLGFS